MGGADKGLVDYQGQRLIDHVLSRIAPQADHILINANRNIETYQALGYPVIADLNKQFDGPLAGMQAGLRHSQTEWVLTVPCDNPLLPLDLAVRLLHAATHQHALIAIARSASGNHPVFSLMHRSVSRSLDHFLSQGQRKVSAWQEQQPHVYAEFEDEAAFTNLNTLT